MSRLVLISIAIFLLPFAIFSKKRIMPTFWLNLILTLIFFIPDMVHDSMGRDKRIIDYTL
jgi:uncharacterized membrane protein YqaE (UPF0057 family)